MNDNIKAGSDIHAGDGGYSISTQEKYDEFVKGRNQSLAKMRIRELALQAGMTDDKFGMYFAVDKHNEDGVDLEKFAELIVKEVTNIVLHYTDVDEGVAVVKKHFGVEE